MSDEINEQPTPEADGAGETPESAPEPAADASAAADSAADVAAAAAALAAQAAASDPAPTESEAQAVEAAADTARETQAEAEAAAGMTDAATPDAGAPEAAARGADEPTAYNMETFDASDSSAEPGEMALLNDVNLDVKIELGRTRMFVEDVLKLTEGAVVELDKLAGDPVDIYVNGRHVARGEVLVLNDNFCVRVSEILDPNVDDPKK